MAPGHNPSLRWRMWTAMEWVSGTKYSVTRTQRMFGKWTFQTWHGADMIGESANLRDAKKIAQAHVDTSHN